MKMDFRHSILIYRLPEAYLNDAVKSLLELTNISKNSISLMKPDHWGAKLILDNERNFREVISLCALNIHNKTYSLYSLATDFTVCGTGAQTDALKVKNLLERCAPVLSAYEMKKQHGVMTFRATLNYPEIPEIVQLWTGSNLKMSGYDGIEFTIASFCRFCRQNGHFKSQCLKRQVPIFQKVTSSSSPLPDCKVPDRQKIPASSSDSSKSAIFGKRSFDVSVYSSNLRVVSDRTTDSELKKSQYKTPVFKKVTSSSPPLPDCKVSYRQTMPASSSDSGKSVNFAKRSFDLTVCTSDKKVVSDRTANSKPKKSQCEAPVFKKVTSSSLPLSNCKIADRLKTTTSSDNSGPANFGKRSSDSKLMSDRTTHSDRNKSQCEQGQVPILKEVTSSSSTLPSSKVADREKIPVPSSDSSVSANCAKRSSDSRVVSSRATVSELKKSRCGERLSPVIKKVTSSSPPLSDCKVSDGQKISSENCGSANFGKKNSDRSVSSSDCRVVSDKATDSQRSQKAAFGITSVKPQASPKNLIYLIPPSMKSDVKALKLFFSDCKNFKNLYKKALRYPAGIETLLRQLRKIIKFNKEIITKSEEEMEFISWICLLLAKLQYIHLKKNVQLEPFYEPYLLGIGEVKSESSD